MSIVLATYDLKAPGKNYDSVHTHLEKFTHCKGLESVWLLDTTKALSTIRDDLRGKIDANDIVFAVKLTRQWPSLSYDCSAWLNDAARNW